MGWQLRRFTLTKAVPLAISRGTTSSVQRLELSLSRGGITGLGETDGLTQALLMAHVARRLELDLMAGCYSDSSLLNGAASQLLSLIRWPDLDSHLNLVDAPFTGALLEGDQLHPSPEMGLGIRLKETERS